MKLEECIVNRLIKNEENENNDKNISEFRTKFQAARNEHGTFALVKYLIQVGDKYAVAPYTNFNQFAQSLAYFVSKVDNPESEEECVHKIIKLGEDKFEKTHYNTFLSLMNTIFNALSVDSKNRLTLLKKMIKICKHNNKEYLFAPYLLNIDDLLNTQAYGLMEQLEIYEEFLSIIDNTIRKDDDYLLITRYMELLSKATPEQFEKKQDKLLKYIVKIVQNDRRLFDMEQAFLQPCCQKLLAVNKDLAACFNTLISGDISNIKHSYGKCKSLFESNDISEDEFSDKVK